MDDKRNLIRRLMTQNTVWIVTLGVLLFISAGSLHWPAAWLFLATLGGLGIVGGFWFVQINPGLLTERMRPMIQKDQPKADKVFILVMGVVSMIWLIVMGLDQRYQWSGIRCIAGRSSFSSEYRCCWDHGGAPQSHRSSSGCSQGVR